MDIGILTKYVHNAAMVASWLQLTRAEWRHIEPTTNGIRGRSGFLLLSLPVLEHCFDWHEVQWLRENNRVIQMPWPATDRTVIAGIKREAQRQGVTLTLEEEERFAIAGHLATRQGD